MCNRCKWSSHTGRCLPRCLFTSELNARYVFRAGCSGVMAPLSRRALTPSVPQSWLVLGACRNSSMDPAHGVADPALLPVYRFIPLPSSALAARAIISPALRAKPWTSTAAGGVAGSKDSAPCGVIAIVFILRPGFLWLFHRAEPFRWSNAARSNPVPPRSGPLQASSWPTKEPRIFRIQVVRVWRVSPGRGRRQG